MKTRIVIICLVILIGVLSFSNKAQAQSASFIIIGADAVKFIDNIGSPELIDIITVDPRFIIVGADANRFYQLEYPIGLIGDYFPPVILNLSITKNGLVSWDTDEYTTGELFWGDQPGTYSTTITDPLYAKSHYIQMSGVIPGITYYYKVRTTDRSGNFTDSLEDTFFIEVPITGLSATNNSPTELGKETTLSATVTAGTHVTYTWNFDDDSNNATGKTVTHTYQSVGTFHATVTATNSVNSSSATTVVSIVDQQITGLKAYNDSPKEFGNCPNFWVTMDTGTNVSYSWDFGDGTLGSGSNSSHCYSTTGDFNVKVKAKNSVSEVEATTKVTIIDQHISGLLAQNNGPKQVGEQVTLWAIKNTGSNVTYTWNFGDGTNPVSGLDLWTVIHSYNGLAGIYTATVTASNTSNVVSDITELTINDVPISGLQVFNDGPTELGHTTKLWATITAGTNVEYTWDFGDGSDHKLGNTVFHNYQTIGTYKVTVTTQNSANSTTTIIYVMIIKKWYLPFLSK